MRDEASEPGSDAAPALPSRLKRCVAVLRRGLMALPSALWPVLALTALWLALLFATTGGGWVDIWLARWARWDALWYLRIWEEGYAAEPLTLVFPPGYPWLTGIGATLTKAPFFAVGSVISLSSLIIAGVVLVKWVERDFGVPGTWVYAFWLCAPAMYFALAPYSDLLFCALLFTALYGLTAPQLNRSQQALLLMVLMALPFIRITAFALFPLLLLRRWQVLAMLPGLGTFLLLNYQVTGDALHFLGVQEQFLMTDGHLLDGLRQAWGGLLPPPPVEKPVDFLRWLQVNAVPLAQLLLLSLTTLWLLRRRQGVVAVVLIGIVLMSHNQAFWRSVVRYDLPVWPLVALPILVTAQQQFFRWRQSLGGFPWAAAAWLASLGALMMLGLLLQWRFAAVFHRGGWGF